MGFAVYSAGVPDSLDLQRRFVYRFFIAVFLTDIRATSTRSILVRCSHTQANASNVSGFSECLSVGREHVALVVTVLSHSVTRSSAVPYTSAGSGTRHLQCGCMRVCNSHRTKRRYCCTAVLLYPFLVLAELVCAGFYDTCLYSTTDCRPRWFRMYDYPFYRNEAICELICVN